MTNDLEKPSTSYVPNGAGIVTGKGVGDFDFLAGHWHIRHKKLKADTKNVWQHFDSSATVHNVLDGMGSIEELRKPDGSYLGMAVRVWLPELGKWADHWTSADTGIVDAPQFGAFVDANGVFISEEGVDGNKWLYRGVWDQIASNKCRWHQSTSQDGGNSWDWNWWMEWMRQSSNGTANE